MIANLIGQLAKFGTVGVANTIIDLIVLNLLTQIFKFRKSFNLGQKKFMIANIISVSFALINSFFFNRFWTFGDSNSGGIFLQIVKFIIITAGAAYLIQQPIFNYFYYKFYSVFPFLRPKDNNNRKDFWQTNISKIIAIVCGAVWNFLGYKFFVFIK